MLFKRTKPGQRPYWTSVGGRLEPEDTDTFAARLTSMDLDARTGAEFSEPGRGTYEVVGLPVTREALSETRLLPSQLAEFAQANIHGLLALIDPANRASTDP